MRRESVGQSVLVAFLLCLVCSLLVSSAAVRLRPRQKANEQRQMQKDVLLVTGLYREGRPVAEQFEEVETKVVNLETGEFVDPETLDPKADDPEAATRDPELSVQIPKEQNIAGIRRREKYSKLFLVRDDEGALDQLVLPVRGKGLWSTMYGFLSLEPDLRTVRGITFYEHGETPGLGGEIQSEGFTRQWKGKMVREPDGNARFSFERGTVEPDDPAAKYKIDAIAGATLTTRGVVNMIRFWMGPMGFKKFLEKQKASGGISGGTA
ncbi:MAG: Na(+)-translocating NADH-quinone reductase subunit C [Planctomycetota bacterium]